MGEYDRVPAKIPYSCLQCHRQADGGDDGLCPACRALNADEKRWREEQTRRTKYGKYQ